MADPLRSMLLSFAAPAFTDPKAQAKNSLEQPASEPERQQAEPSARCIALRKRMASGQRDNCVIFYHVPKTSGASYQRPAGWSEWSNYGPLPQPPPKELRKDWIFLRGHWTPQFKTEYLRRNCWQITMLRDPVMHALSAFYFHGHATNEWESCLRGSCESTMRNGDACCAEQYVNGQTRQLAGGHGVDLYTGALSLEFPLPSTALPAAKANLEAMDLVGTSEDQDLLARMLAIVLRVNRPHTEKGSVAPKSVEQSLSLSNETLEAVRAANADDAQLYALAQSLAADDARCLSGHTARPKHAAAILQLVRNGTATNLVTISDDESGLLAFRVSRRGKRVAESLRRR